MILQKPEGSGSEQRGRMTGGVFQDTESGKCQGNHRSGVFTGQEAPVVAAGCVWVSGDERKTGETLHGRLDLTETTLGELEREHVKWETGPDFLAGGAL